MQQKTVEIILRALGSTKLSPSGTNWVITNCPLAPTRHSKGKDRKPSLGVSVGPGQSFVKCHSCGIGGPIRFLVSASRRDGLIDEETAQALLAKCERIMKYEPAVPDVEFVEQPLLDPDILPMLDTWHDYYATRKFSKAEIAEWRFGHMKNFAALFPCVLGDGSIPYVQARPFKRDADSDAPFWFMPEGVQREHVAGAHLLTGTETAIIFCEGPFDALRTRRAVRKMGKLKDYGVVFGYGSKINADQRDHLFGLVKKELIICSDNDMAGDQCAEMLEEDGRKRVPTVSRVYLPEGVKDPDEAGSTLLGKLIAERTNLLTSRMRNVLSAT